MAPGAPFEAHVDRCRGVGLEPKAVAGRFLYDRDGGMNAVSPTSVAEVRSAGPGASASAAPGGVAAPGSAPLTCWERTAFGAVRAAMAAAVAAFGLGGVYAIGRGFGTLEWLINHKRRRRFAEAMKRVFPEGAPPAAVRRWCREFVCQTRCDKLFFLILDCVPRERAASLFSVEPRRLLDEPLARGRGVYVALAHHGAHHVGGTLLCLLGYKVAGVRDAHEGGLRRYAQERFRQKLPDLPQMRMFFSETFPRALFRCLKEGYVLGSAIDVSRVRGPNQKTEIVTLFGERREFLSGPMRIALRTGAAVLQGFVLREPGFRYRLVLEGPLVEPLSNPGDRPPAGLGVEGAFQTGQRPVPLERGREDDAVAAAMQRYAANVERQVRARPDQISRI